MSDPTAAAAPDSLQKYIFNRLRTRRVAGNRQWAIKGIIQKNITNEEAPIRAECIGPPDRPE